MKGNVVGREIHAEKVILDTFEITSGITSAITRCDGDDYGSVGMDIMKHYTVVLNYCKAYAGFKKSQRQAK